MRKTLVMAFVGLLATTLGVGDASAQYRRARYGYRARVGVGVAAAPMGFYAGVGLLGNKIVAQSGGPELLKDGGGVSIYGGLHLSSRFSLELGFMSSFHNPATVDVGWGTDIDYLVLDALTLDAKYHFESTGTLVPFVQGGVGGYALSSQYFRTDSVGSGFQLGGGFDVWLGQFWTLDVRLLYRGLSMGPPDSTYNDTFVSCATVEGSLAFNF